jgi:S1-C subfamily serine protease
MNRADTSAAVQNTGAGRRRRRGVSRWSRLAGIGVATTLMTVTSSYAGAAVRIVTSPSGAVLTSRWSYSQSEYGQSEYGQSTGTQDGYAPWGQSGADGSGGTQQSPEGSTGSSSTSTVDSQAATKAQSAGVVLIDTVLGYENAEAAGTGIVLTSSGEVLTNYHVVEGATSIKVTIASTGKSYTASVVGDSQKSDIALLQLKGAPSLTTAKVDDDTLKSGDEVTAVGNAGGTDSLSAADGSVTALSQSITTESESGTAGESLSGLIETSADVVAGDSGGPLYDDEGEVSGIDTAASSGGTAINGYAIPIDTALGIVRQILAGHETSTIRIGSAAFLGVEVTASASTDQQQSSADWYGAQSEDQSEVSGAEVAGVVDASPAARAGVEAGDVITSVGGRTITSATDLTSTLKKQSPGDKVTLVWTDSTGGSHSASVTLATSPVV